jgi:uncharacterized phage protein (TIGR01671 family)
LRKFHFRVWHKIEKRFLDPWDEEDPIFNLKDYTDSKWGVDVAVYDRDKRGWISLNEDDIVIQQSTGIFDSEGVEIFEGDILLYFESEDDWGRWEVSWNEDRLCWYLDDDTFLYEYKSLTNNTTHLKIDGHIYEDTEIRDS